MNCYAVAKVDDADKLLDVKVGGVAVKEFTYNAAGRTTSITANSVTRDFSYDFESRPWAVGAA